MRVRLTEQQTAEILTSLPGWSIVNGKLHRELQFPDFIHAFGFMASAAVAIEKQNHHPEWSNVYGRVLIDLTTHDAGGITESDVKLASTLEALASRLL